MSRPFSSRSAGVAALRSSSATAAVSAGDATVLVANGRDAAGAGRFGTYMRSLSDIVMGAAVTDARGRAIALETAVKRMGRTMHQAHERGNRVFFVGNGGSAGICSHMATDYSKNGGIRASALNDGSVLTCLSNDYGYEHVFSKQLGWHARGGDVVVAISSSGKSQNILNACGAARELGCELLTFSGFGADNPLRGLGDLNVYLASRVYGFVEIGHESILHGVLDIHMGWKADAHPPHGKGKRGRRPGNGAAETATRDRA